MKATNREGWLTELAAQVRPIFTGFEIGPYRVSCGWPSERALGKKSRVIGQCFACRVSKGGIFEMFISPLLEKPIEVAGVQACRSHEGDSVSSVSWENPDKQATGHARKAGTIPTPCPRSHKEGDGAGANCL